MSSKQPKHYAPLAEKYLDFLEKKEKQKISRVYLRIRAGGKQIPSDLLSHIKDRMLDGGLNATLCVRDYVHFPNSYNMGYNIMGIYVEETDDELY